jgi:hypothetical protein
MSVRSLGNLVGLALAVVVPGLALAAAAGPEHRSLGLAVAPFGWPRLLVVHLLATLPLSLLAAKKGSGAFFAPHDDAPPDTADAEKAPHPFLAWAGIWAALGAGLAWATVAAGAAVGEGLDREQADFSVRLAVRVLWCLGLQLPWCLLGQCLSVRAWPGGPRRAEGVLALLLAVAPPAVYAIGLIEAQTKKAGELLQGLRLTRARAIVAGLCDLGSAAALAGTPPPVLRREIVQAIRASTAALEHPLPEPASAEARVERARLLAVLDRLDEAARLLEPLADTDPAAALLRAAVLQDQRRWEESSRCYRRALVLLQEAPPSDPAALAGRVKAYDGLAFNARGRKAYREAEVAYHEALERLPAARAHFHFQLGRHHQLGGRPGPALHHLRTAARLDPGRFAEPARPLLDELTMHTPGCLLRWHGP